MKRDGEGGGVINCPSIIVKENYFLLIVEDLN
jgi:hypothetical protein